MRKAGMRKALAIAAALFCIAAAPDPADMLKDPAQEARARTLFHQVRCVVCQNESIDDSEADLAHDLRQLIRSQVAAGKSDAEIQAFLVSKYGDFILLKPRFNAMTAIIWVVPFANVAGGVGLLIARRRRTLESADDLSPEEQAKLKSLVDQPEI
jgi:cytochrome c-type biogenesis protein CcmH